MSYTNNHLIIMNEYLVMTFLCNKAIRKLDDDNRDNNSGISWVPLGNGAMHNLHGSNMDNMMDMVFQICALKIQHLKGLSIVRLYLFIVLISF